MTRRFRKKVWLLFFPLFISTTLPILEGMAIAAQVTTPSGVVIEMTAKQLEALKTQPYVIFSINFPTLKEGQIAMEIPAQLGGGFIVGKPAAIATGMNAVGITIGAKESSVRRIKFIVLPVIAFTALLGIIVGLAGGSDEATPPSH